LFYIDIWRAWIPVNPYASSLRITFEFYAANALGVVKGLLLNFISKLLKRSVF